MAVKTMQIGLEGIANLALHNAHSGNLGNFLARRIESGGLKVEQVLATFSISIRSCCMALLSPQNIPLSLDTNDRNSQQSSPLPLHSLHTPYKIEFLHCRVNP